MCPQASTPYSASKGVEVDGHKLLVFFLKLQSSCEVGSRKQGREDYAVRTFFVREPMFRAALLAVVACLPCLISATNELFREHMLAAALLCCIDDRSTDKLPVNRRYVCQKFAVSNVTFVRRLNGCSAADCGLLDKGSELAIYSVT